jgi:hypothetical protein
LSIQPREEGVLRIFIALKNPSPWPGFKPTTFGPSGQHTNNYVTKVTLKFPNFFILLLFLFHLFVFRSLFVLMLAIKALRVDSAC